MRRLANDGDAIEPFAVLRPSDVADVQVNATDVYLAGYEVARQGKAETPPAVLCYSDIGTDALAIDATHAYFSIGRGADLIARVPLAGGDRQRVAAAALDQTGRVQLQADVIEVDDTHVYWTSERGPGLQRTSKDGSGATELVVPGLDHARFAVDARNVYWAEAGGAVKAAPKDGQAPRPRFPTASR